MKSQCRFVAVLGALALLSAPTRARAQDQAHVVDPSGFIAALSSGSIQGVVRDEQGMPVGGALVSALGATTAFTKTDLSGRFDLSLLTPGPYLIRAHLSGFVAPQVHSPDSASKRVNGSPSGRPTPPNG